MTRLIVSLILLGALTSPVRADSQLETWIDALDSKEPDRRAQAAKSLGDLGPAAHPAIPALTHTLDDREPHVRQLAARALGRIGKRARTAGKKLQAKLADPVDGVKVASAVALVRVGESRKEALQLLTRLLSDRSPRRRKLAATGLGALGLEARSAVPALTRALREQVEDESFKGFGGMGPTALVKRPEASRATRAIVEALASIGLNVEPAVEVLLEKLEHRDRFVKRSAAIALGMLGPNARRAAPKIRELVAFQPKNESEKYARLSLGFALIRVGDNQGGVGVFLEALEDEDTHVAGTAAQALRNELLKDPETCLAALPTAMGWLSHAKGDKRMFGVAVLGYMAKHLPPPGRAALARSLKDEDPRVRKLAVLGLGKLGPDGLVHLRGAFAALKPDVKGEAAVWLFRAGDPVAREHFVRLLASADPKVRESATYQLGNTRSAGAGALLAKGLQDEAVGVARMAAWCLCHRMSTVRLSPSVLEALRSALKHSDEAVRRDVKQALEHQDYLAKTGK